MTPGVCFLGLSPPSGVPEVRLSRFLYLTLNIWGGREERKDAEGCGLLRKSMDLFGIPKISRVQKVRVLHLERGLREHSLSPGPVK